MKTKEGDRFSWQVRYYIFNVPVNVCMCMCAAYFNNICKNICCLQGTICLYISVRISYVFNLYKFLAGKRSERRWLFSSHSWNTQARGRLGNAEFSLLFIRFDFLSLVDHWTYFPSLFINCNYQLTLSYKIVFLLTLFSPPHTIKNFSFWKNMYFFVNALLIFILILLDFGKW